jgi:hypothetical protein
LLFAADLESTVGVYESTDRGKTWTPLSGSPSETIFTLVWASQEGLLVGGNGGLWLWEPSGDWKQLIVLDVTEKDQRILSATVLPAEIFTILAGGEDGIYVWQEGDPVQTVPRNDVVKKAWSVALVSKPEPYAIALTFPNSTVWQMNTDGKNPQKMKQVGSDGFPLIVQNEDPLRLWIGTVDGLYMGELLNKTSGLFNGNK